ncbi:ergothioneine biosynthesis protein EgtB [Solimicrobium silvestre]|uniref:Ergothioneine biosynthesis protein EgtB n=1 Tax=Solimicrobium silvestre TaxID=2099400 RepID=A0A2S9H3Q5_9BURK|nr:ergothioneine biosynthesis protein EgtB [Solimicrobium silvestre]PRC94591.1 Ergothioneine biosynthesis protein EgtB [Solimicrobium silvestre]
MQVQTETDPKISAHLLQRFNEVRKFSVSLAKPLSEEDCCIQSMPDASPMKWHLAHTTWFFETFILERFEINFRPYHQAYRVLFNSYYNGVGQKHPRAQRGLLSRPSTNEVIAYRHNVDMRMGALLERAISNDSVSESILDLISLTELGIQHEQQHQELMLTDIKHMLSMNPLFPAYENSLPVRHRSSLENADKVTWISLDAGVVMIGYDAISFCFDNEIPRHRQFVEAFSMASRLVTNAEYAVFIDAGGYRNPVHWLAEGWDWVRNQGLTQPLYWYRPDDKLWHEFTLHGLQRLDPQAPAIHLSYFEADAYAHWAGARLPTEFEWEMAATTSSSSAQLLQLFGTAWQWTSSSYAPYPGFVAAEGVVGEYNGKFMVNQYVLRGSSCVTPVGHTRTTYRNFFSVGARWQFTGIRLAKSI